MRDYPSTNSSVLVRANRYVYCIYWWPIKFSKIKSLASIVPRSSEIFNATHTNLKLKEPGIKALLCCNVIYQHIHSSLMV